MAGPPTEETINEEFHCLGHDSPLWCAIRIDGGCRHTHTGPDAALLDLGATCLGERCPAVATGNENHLLNAHVAIIGTDSASPILLRFFCFQDDT